jgi:hypothetical protein
MVMAVLPVVALVVQVQACWFIDDNFVRKDCGIMPRKYLCIVHQTVASSLTHNTYQLPNEIFKYMDSKKP